MADYAKGAGTFSRYPIFTFEDSSALWLNSIGTGTVDGTKTQI
jgi:hypothetical protein